MLNREPVTVPDSNRSPVGEATLAGGPELALPSLGDYEVLEEIPRGGMGVVYRARQKSLHRHGNLLATGIGDARVRVWDATPWPVEKND